MTLSRRWQSQGIRDCHHHLTLNRGVRLEATISIVGRHIALRPLLASDLQSIFQWRSNISDLHLWFQRPEILSFDEFLNDFNGFVKNFVHVLMVLTRPTTANVPIGMVYSYRPDYLNGHTFLCAFLASEYRGYLYGAEGSMLFVDYLFSYFPFRKIYAEVYEYNDDSLHNVTKGGWREEGRLKKHRWYSDDYKDMLIFALYREDFYTRFGKLLSSVKVTTYGTG